MKEGKGYVIALYIRLSSEDGDLERTEMKEESNSVSGQRAYLYEFIQSKPEFSSCTIIEKVDDGYTGVNFERPGFTELMELAKKGEVNCIVVKDFSRFGRNYIELGDYLEQLFPFLGIRFISVNDGYDSEQYKGSTGGIDVGFKNLIYELYSRDLSVKVRKVIRAKQEKGEYLSGYPLYGYMHCPGDKRKLVIDEESAQVVREIFELRHGGMRLKDIAKTLNDRNILTPSEYAFQKRGKKKSFNLGNKSLWTVGILQRVLDEERYTGVMVSHQHESAGMKGNNTCVTRGNWIRVEGTHEPIIAKELYHAIRKKSTRDYGKGVNRKPRGIYVCGICNHTLQCRTKDDVLKCHYGRYEADSACDHIFIQRTELENAILSAIKMQALLLSEKVKMSEYEKEDDNPLKLKKQINDIKDNLELLNRSKLNLYEKYRDSIFSKEDYLENKDAYDQQIIQLEEKKEQLWSRLNLGENLEEVKQKVNEITSYSSKVETLTEEVKHALIEKVLVYEGQRIEIVWKYQDITLALLPEK